MSIFFIVTLVLRFRTPHQRPAPLIVHCKEKNFSAFANSDLTRAALAFVFERPTRRLCRVMECHCHGVMAESSVARGRRKGDMENGRAQMWRAARVRGLGRRDLARGGLVVHCRVHSIAAAL